MLNSWKRGIDEAYESFCSDEALHANIHLLDVGEGNLFIEFEPDGCYRLLLEDSIPADYQSDGVMVAVTLLSPEETEQAWGEALDRASKKLVSDFNEELERRIKEGWN